MMNHRIKRRRLYTRFMLAAAALPLFGTTCAERSIDFLFGRDSLEDLFDDRSDSERVEDILDDIEDLFDDVF